MAGFDLVMVEGAFFRVVESQRQVGTLKFVDSLEEQELLEELIESVKPKVPQGAPYHGLHYLLFTPFRYAPLPYGSRFGRKDEDGIWYGSAGLETALAEVAYYRFVFLEGARALRRLSVELTSFHAAVRTARGVDCGAPAFREHAEASSKVDYSYSQRLGRAMREAGVEAFLYDSARDPSGGKNVGLFVPCFSRKTPAAAEAWACIAGRERVDFVRRTGFRSTKLSFARAQFEVDGELPTPGLKAA